MKLGKSLIIAGVLFSSVLGSINVGNVTAMAAVDTSISSANDLSSVDITYRGDGFFKIANVKVFVNPDGTISRNDIPAPKKDAASAKKGLYRIKPGQTFNLVKNSVSGAKSVTVEMEKLKTVAVRYFIDGNTRTDLNDRINIPVTNNFATKDDLMFNWDNNVRPVDGKTTFKIDNDGVVRVNLETTRLVNIFYDGEDGSTAKLPFGVMTVLAGKNEVSSDEVPTLEGYELVSGQTYKIAKDGTKGMIHVKVKGVKINQPDLPSNPENTGNTTKPDAKPTTKPSYSTRPTGSSRPSSSQHVDTIKKVVPTMLSKRGVVTTNSKGLFKQLYTLEGSKITNRGLAGNSSWQTDQYAVINGETMYRVATNEWLKLSDIQSLN